MQPTLDSLFSPSLDFAPMGGDDFESLIAKLSGQDNQNKPMEMLDMGENYFKESMFKKGPSPNIMDLLAQQYGPDFRNKPEIKALLGHFNNQLTNQVGVSNLGKLLKSSQTAMDYIAGNQGLSAGSASQRMGV